MALTKASLSFYVAVQKKKDYRYIPLKVPNVEFDFDIRLLPLTH